MSGSASFQRAKKSSYAERAVRLHSRVLQRPSPFEWTLRVRSKSASVRWRCKKKLVVGILGVIDKMGRQEQDGSASRERAL